MTIREALQSFRQYLHESPTAYLDVELILQEALQISRETLHRESQREIQAAQLARIQNWVDRRKSGEPVAYLVGHKDFYINRFVVGPGVLIPRPETEALVIEALRTFPKEDAQIADFGAGSGCIGLSLIAERPRWHLLAVEASSEAALFLKQNLKNLNLGNRTEVFERSVDELDPALRFDGIVANPPYLAVDDPHVDLNVRRFEPSTALFAESEGFDALFSWSRIARARLRPGGIFITEIGFQQAPRMLEFLNSELGFIKTRVVKDLSGHDRMLCAEVARG
jgi:release factor glutamine methyltransferase